MSAMGVKIEQFEVPVCNSFKAKLINHQLCYEVDLNEFSVKSNVAKELDLGFSFLMDYNEDRQVIFDQEIRQLRYSYGLTKSVVSSDQSRHAFVYLDTIGRTL